MNLCVIYSVSSTIPSQEKKLNTLLENLEFSDLNDLSLPLNLNLKNSKGMFLVADLFNDEILNFTFEIADKTIHLKRYIKKAS